MNNERKRLRAEKEDIKKKLEGKIKILKDDLLISKNYLTENNQ